VKQSLPDTLIQLLTQHKGLTEQELVQHLMRRGHGVTRSRVYYALKAAPDQFQSEVIVPRLFSTDSEVVRWSLVPLGSQAKNPVFAPALRTKQLSPSTDQINLDSTSTGQVLSGSVQSPLPPPQLRPMRLSNATSAAQGNQGIIQPPQLAQSDLSLSDVSVLQQDSAQSVAPNLRLIPWIQLVVLVDHNPGLGVRELTNLMNLQYQSSYIEVEVSAALCEDPTTFCSRGTAPQQWYVIDKTPVPVKKPVISIPVKHTTVTHTPLEDYFDRLGLWPWQRRALRSWAESGYKGVVEAVTGTGKTRVGIAAAAWAAKNRRRTLILVPTTDLQRQWCRELRNQLRDVRTGLLGDGAHDRFTDHDIIVSTIQSCIHHLSSLRTGKGLLIADECHRYGGTKWAQALQESFPYRLGLTATYERSDDGVHDELTPYFKQKVYTIEYAEALRDDVIAHFKIAFLGVPFSADERYQYEVADSGVRWAAGILLNQRGLPAKPFGTFIKEVTRLKDQDDPIAGYYLSAFTERRRILAEARAKLERLAALSGAAACSQGTIVFTQTQAAAKAAARMLHNQGLPTAFLHSDLDGDTRRSILQDFAEGDTLVIAAPKLLDEGIDVPAADLAIILASSRTRLQMVQRMGRVLRKKTDNRLARIVIMYVADTSEDPAQGAHEAFLDLVIPHAVDSCYFSPTDSAEKICAYLNDWHHRR